MHDFLVYSLLPRMHVSEEGEDRRSFGAGFLLRLCSSLQAHLVHGADQVVNVLLAIAMLATLNEMQALLRQAACRRVQLERPQEVAALLKGRSHCVDLVDQVLNADDVVGTQSLQGNPLAIDTGAFKPT